jgi:hypothetical protein
MFRHCYPAVQHIEFISFFNSDATEMREDGVSFAATRGRYDGKRPVSSMLQKYNPKILFRHSFL